MKTPYNQAINLETFAMGKNERKWMTKTGGVLLALSQILPAFGLPLDIAEAASQIMSGLGAMFGFIGLGRKLDRIN